MVVDANVLINLAHLDRLDLLGALEGFDFVIPEEVRQEVKSVGARDRCRFRMAFGSFWEIL